VATYNVHGWVDAAEDSNLDRVVEVVNTQDPDILCLQEIYPCWDSPCLLEFLRKTKFEHTLRWEGCAILSKKQFLLSEYGGREGTGLGCEDHVKNSGGNYHALLAPAPGFGFNRPRYVTAAVQMDCADVQMDSSEKFAFFLTCIHLIPKYSELRFEEVARVSNDLKPIFNENYPQLWIGDFNTLTQGDYTKSEWEEIVRIRKQNGRKDPVNDVIEGIQALGLKDNWTKAGRPEPRTTSRFDTRVDYVFSNKSFEDNWTLTSFLHYPHNASDHSFVMAEFQQEMA